MSIKKRLIPALVAGALAMGASSAQAINFSAVYVFGDSLSDSGYYRPGIAALLGSTAAAGVGKFTTNPGPVWSEIIAQYYGGNGNPANAGGGIYAQGGMRVTLPSPASLVGPGGTQRPVSTQITEFLSKGAADPNALYGVWVGANDMFSNLGLFQAGAIDATALQNNVLAAANAEIGQIARLQAAGAKYILVFNIPDVGATPQFAGPLASSVTALAGGYNTTLFTGLQGAGLKVIPVDAFALLTDVRANAAAFGFTNTSATACNLALTQGTSLFCSGATLTAPGAATSYLFADGVHPTTGAHRIVADFVKSLIEGPNAYSMMAEVPLSSRAAHIRTLDEGVRQGQSQQVGRLSAFAGFDGSKYDVTGTSLSPQTDTKNRAITVGVTMRASEALTVGMGVGSTKGEANMGSVGGFDVKETALSFFGNVKSNGWYANFTATGANLKFDNIRRSVVLGPVTRVATSSTKGSNGSASVMGGYDFTIGSLEVGPFVGMTVQDIKVNKLTETGAGAANLNIFDQSRSSRVNSVGVRASMKLGNWTPFLRVSADNDSQNEERFVSANPVSVTSGNTYDIPGYKGDGSWTTVTAGIRGKLADKVGLSVVYTGVSSKQNVKQDGVSAAVSFDF